MDRLDASETLRRFEAAVTEARAFFAIDPLWQTPVQAVGGGQYGRFEPVSPDALIATKTDAYHDMLDEAAQSHIRMSGDATASGESRIQAMNDFNTLTGKLMRDAIETATVRFERLFLRERSDASG